MRQFVFEISKPGAGKTETVEVEAETCREAIVKAEREHGGRVSRGSSVDVDPNLRSLGEVFPELA